MIDFLAASVASNTLGYTQDLLGGPFNYGITIDATSPTVTSLSNQELYRTQYQLRQDSDIEGAAGTVKNGKLTDELLAFVGSTLTTKLATNIDQDGTKTGVAITSIRSAEMNNTSCVMTTTFFSHSCSQDSHIIVRTISWQTVIRQVFVYYDYTRQYTGTSVVISLQVRQRQILPRIARVTRTSWNTTPLLRPNTPEGLNPSVEADAYFKFTGFTNPDNNEFQGHEYY